MTNNFIPLTRDGNATDKPDLVDDVLDGGLKESYELGVDHCIKIVETFLLYMPGLQQPLINKLKSLKK
jgi:hypothetical protein